MPTKPGEQSDESPCTILGQNSDHNVSYLRLRRRLWLRRHDELVDIVTLLAVVGEGGGVNVEGGGRDKLAARRDGVRSESNEA